MGKVARPEAFPPLTDEIRGRVEARLKEIAAPVPPTRYGRRKAATAQPEPPERTAERHILTRYLAGDTRFLQMYCIEAVRADCEPPPATGRQVNGKPLSEEDQISYQATCRRLNAKRDAAQATYDMVAAIWQRLSEEVIKTPR
jgi:hypothetical protein